MKIIRTLAFLLLAGVTLAAAAGKPEPVETLRRDALAKMRAFVESRPQSPASEQAENRPNASSRKKRPTRIQTAGSAKPSASAEAYSGKILLRATGRRSVGRHC